MLQPLRLLHTPSTAVVDGCTTIGVCQPDQAESCQLGAFYLLISKQDLHRYSCHILVYQESLHLYFQGILLPVGTIILLDTPTTLHGFVPL